MPHSGSGLYFCSLWGAAMSFLIFSVYCFNALIQTKEISRQGPIFWVLNFHSEEPLKTFQSHPLYIYLKWFISAWVLAELVCDLLDCFILLCNLILPPALYLGVWECDTGSISDSDRAKYIVLRCRSQDMTYKLAPALCLSRVCRGPAVSDTSKSGESWV